MKAKITRLGETIELEGTPDELERFIKPVVVPVIDIQTLPYIPFPYVEPLKYPAFPEFPWPYPTVICNNKNQLSQS